jgi:precorrin-2/cobalt-factor-2 C20-methyltransferase
MTGRFYGVGVGPGDPELITVKAYRVLKETPVIAYPKKRRGSRSYALDIVETYVDANSKTLVGLVFPMTKDAAVLAREWDRTAQTVAEYLVRGEDVAFVTEGDPMLYSTFIHLARTVTDKIPDVTVTAIPGISSVTASASVLGLPLADGDETVAVVPATADRERLKTLLSHHDAVVLVKVAKVLDVVLEVLEDLGLTDRARVVTQATHQAERVWTRVEELSGAELPYLTLMVVKK